MRACELPGATTVKHPTVSTLFTLVALALAPLAQARGCLKGAAVGAVAGHVAGHHAVVGAVGGCLVGHHLAHKKTIDDKAGAAPQPVPAPASAGPAAAAAGPARPAGLAAD
jgi:hypothetical protein